MPRQQRVIGVCAALALLLALSSPLCAIAQEGPGQGNDDRALDPTDGASSIAEAGDLASLSSAELAALEERLTREVSESNKALEALRAETDQLRGEQEEIDRDARELADAREIEAKKKEKREKELEDAKLDVQRKQASIARMSVRVTELKEQIDALEAKLVDLAKEKNETERRYNDPTFADVLGSRSANWGDVPRNVYIKTVNDVLPAFSRISDVAQRYRRRVSKTSRALELLASLLVYGFVLGFVYASYKIYRKVRGNLTVDRLLFLGDAFCAGFWTIVLLCYTFLLEDPLHVIQTNNPLFFFVFQLAVISNYVMYVLLRVLVLASQMSLKALGEVLAVIVVGQHYYVRVWQPSILDENFGGTFFFYFCYAWMFVAFAYKRADQFSPLKQLRGEKLPLIPSLRILFARISGKSIPDGDIETQFPAAAHTPVAVEEPSNVAHRNS